MILVDSREGSKHLAPQLKAMGVPTEIMQLDFGDVCFSGSGPDGATLSIGIELKKLPDLLGSFASGRLVGHQVPGLMASFDAVWLLVEGRYRSGPSGLLEWARESDLRDGKTMVRWSDAGYGDRRWMYREIEHRLTTLELKAGIHVAKTMDGAETAVWIAALYDWWTRNEWDEHTSHIATAMKYTRPSMGGATPLLPPSLKERIAAQLPGVGAVNAAMAAGKFNSVAEMINAEWGTWAQLPRIGKKVAQGIVAAIRGE